MKKTILIFLFASFFSCNSVKTAQKSINSGNYDHAIKIAVTQLRKDKTKESNQPYIEVLSGAYEKATQKDLNRINFLIKDGSPRKLETIYNIYIQLKNRQKLIKPLTPLTNTITGETAIFEFHNYDEDIINYKNKHSEYLYTKAKELLLSDRKLDYRRAYTILNQLNEINYNYKDTRNLMNEAHIKGIDYVLVNIYNDSEIVIPKRLEEYLLNFDTYGLNDFWTVFDGYENRKVAYNFRIELNILGIVISPERINEKEFIFEKQVIDGYIFAVDEKGKEILDKNGRKIKVDKFVDATCSVNRILQTKSTRIIGQVKFINAFSEENLSIFPLDCTYIFEHKFGKAVGDTRALSDEFFNLTRDKRIPFPSNEQMVFDAGDDLKNQLKEIILKSSFRN